MVDLRVTVDPKDLVDLREDLMVDPVVVVLDMEVLLVFLVVDTPRVAMETKEDILVEVDMAIKEVILPEVLVDILVAQ